MQTGEILGQPGIIIVQKTKESDIYFFITNNPKTAEQIKKSLDGKILTHDDIKKTQEGKDSYLLQQVNFEGISFLAYKLVIQKTLNKYLL